MPGWLGNLGGFLEEGMSELVLRTDRFDHEGGKGGMPGRGIIPGTHSAFLPPTPQGP